jgi:cytochrome c553
MRNLITAVFMLAFVTGVLGQSSSTPPRPAAPAQGRTAVKPDGDLVQLMRGILFPNSNLLFDVQDHDPGAPPKQEAAAGGGASNNYANVYAGWPAVEAAAVALAESTDLILKPGRVCSNGKPVPVGRADFVKYAEGLRTAARKSLAAALAKNQEQVSDSTNDIADACSNCHEPYRDKGPVGSPARCTP